MKTWLKRLSKAFLILLFLFVCAWWFENWRGAQALKKAQARAESAGLSLNIADLQKAPIPDDENLLKNPDFLAEWNGEIEPPLDRWRSMKLPGLKDSLRTFIDETSGQPNDYREFFEEELTEDEALQKLLESSQETQDRLNRLATIILSYPIHDLGSNSASISEEPLPEIRFNSILGLTFSFLDQAVIALRLGRADIALRNIRVINRIEAVFFRPSGLHFVLGNSVLQISNTIIWEGIRLHAWDDGQLEQLNSILSKRGPSLNLDQVIRFETIRNLHLLDHFEKYREKIVAAWNDLSKNQTEMPLIERLQLNLNTRGPSGWTSQRKAIAINQTIDFLEILESGQVEYIDSIFIISWKKPTGYSPFEFVESSTGGFPGYASIALKTTTRNRIAQLAIALEQHFLKTGSYPATLGELDYQFDITDVMDPKKRPLAYQPGPDGRPEIWTIKDPAIRWQFSPPPEKQKKKKKNSDH